MYDIKIERQIAFEENYPIVCHSGYLSAMGDEYGYLCGYVGEKLHCFIPFVVKRKLIFNYLEMKCETVMIADDVDEQIFLDQVVAYCRKFTNYDFIAQPPTNVLFSCAPEGAQKAPFGSYRVDLSKSEEALWKNIHAKHRNVIRRAKKNGVEIHFGEAWFTPVYRNITQTLARNGMSMIAETKLRQLLLNIPESVLVACSMFEGEVQSSAIVLYSKHRGYYFWGGTSPHCHLGANNLLHWKIMKRLKREGVKTYDFVGARIDPSEHPRLAGIQRFKSRFGASLERGYLWKYPLKQWKYDLFYALLRLKQKKGDIIDQEKDTLDV